MLMDIGASFLKWEENGCYTERGYDEFSVNGLEILLDRDAPHYIACQAGAFIDQNNNIKNWGYKPRTQDIPLKDWLLQHSSVKFVGYDYEMAILGADLKEGEVLVNMGTGGQVTAPGRYQTNEHLMIRSRDYTTIRYIPCGKVLAHVEGMSEDICFQDLQNIKLQELICTGLDVNPAWYSKQANFPGFIKGITLENFTLRNLFLATFYGILERFWRCIRKINLNPVVVKLTGGIAEKIPVVKAFFSQYYQNVEIVDHATFKGLKKIQEEI